MNQSAGFALWVTGLPASGKSTITRELITLLRADNIPVVVLESDEMRRILTPEPTYCEEERNRFYRQLALIGEVVVRNGLNVIFDATANKRAYRDGARERIARFAEIHVRTPLDVCINRDPKWIYGKAMQTGTGTVPGIQAAYEEPLNPEVILDGTDSARSSAHTILRFLKHRHYI